MPTNGDPMDNVQLTAAAKAAEAYEKARTMALDDQRKEAPSLAYTANRSNRSSMLPLTNGRLAFENFYNSYVKPYYLWNQASDLPFLAAWPKPIDWQTKIDKLDSKGQPVLNSDGQPEWEWANPLRRIYPNAHFISEERYQQFEQAIIDSGEAAYQALWALEVRKSRWQEASIEANIRSDDLWYRRYVTDLPPHDDQEGGDKPRENTCRRIRMLPLSRGRLLFENFYNSYVKPYYLWNQASDLPFLAAWPKPIDWQTKIDKLDSKGQPVLNSDGQPEWEWANPHRRLYPNAHFISEERYQQFEQAIIDSGEAAYQTLWALEVRKSKWQEASIEANIRSDDFWYRRYMTDLPPDPDEDDGGEQSGTLRATGDGGTPPSSPGLASVEA